MDSLSDALTAAPESKYLYNGRLGYAYRIDKKKRTHPRVTKLPISQSDWRKRPRLKDEEKKTIKSNLVRRRR